MERIASLHANLLFTILLVFGALALWGLAAGLLARPAGSLYLSALTIGWLLVASEILLGALLLAGGMRPARLELHVIYAVVAAAIPPAAHRYARRLRAREQMLVYALACAFLCAVALRGLETAR